MPVERCDRGNQECNKWAERVDARMSLLILCGADDDCGNVGRSGWRIETRTLIVIGRAVEVREDLLVRHQFANRGIFY